jgi:carbon-monoxide dehydrogenase medium subunit
MAGAFVAATARGVRIAFMATAQGAVRHPPAEAALGPDLSGIEAALATLGDLDVAADLNGSEAAKRHLAGVALRRAVKEARS